MQLAAESLGFTVGTVVEARFGDAWNSRRQYTAVRWLSAVYFRSVCFAAAAAAGLVSIIQNGATLDGNRPAERPSVTGYPLDPEGPPVTFP